ncbi:MAG: putative glycosyl hydrolase 6 [Ferruginibacter sp.]|nr:putative glycosyl hydrolase 6 [Ferruginibacter sp.]
MKINFFWLMVNVVMLVSSCNTAHHASSVTNGIDLSSIDPGHYDTTWWNRAPYRLVQTNLREIDATMDVAAYVQSMVDASANIVLINVGGIVANYPTQLPFQFRNNFMKGDLVGDLVKGLHAKGIKVIGRFDFSKINETLAAKKPEWLYVSTAGKNVNYNGQVHTCPNGGYQQEYSMEILKEAITAYPLDGIFFNMIGYTTSDYSGTYYGICQCENCSKKFHDFGGHDLPVKSDMSDPVFREYNAFKKKTADKLFEQIKDHIKALNPKLMINTYAEAGVDMIASESGAELTPEYEWNYSATDNVKRVLGSYKDRSPGNLLIYFQAIGYRHVGTSPNMAKTWLLENLLHGAPLGFVVVGTLVNYEDRIFIPTLNNLYGFHKANEKLFTNVEAVNKVALIRGSKDEYEGLIKLLTEEHIMYDIIEPSVLGTSRTPRKLEEYEAVILGDVSNMDDRLIGVVDAYVKNGGKVLATGFTSTRDILGKPLNHIRLQSLGVDPVYEPFQRAKSTYLKISTTDKTALGERAFKDFSIMMLYSDFMKCRPATTAKGYMNFLPATRFGPPEKAYFTQEEITAFPGLISNDFGKGKSVFIPWELGAQYLAKGHYMHRRLFVSALDNLLNVERTLVTNASPMIELSHLANRNGAFEWIGMINHSGQIGGSLLEPVAIYNTNIRFKPVKAIKELRLMRAGISLNFKQENGWVECTVSKLDDFEMILCLYK